MAYNKLKALNANIEAIETAMRLTTQGLKPTEADRETLSQYSGFGGIKEVLNIGTDNPMPTDMSEAIGRLQSLIENFRGFADDAMRKNAIDGIKASVLTAFYTPQYIIDALSCEVHSLFARQRISLRSFLEPSAGIGGFLPIATENTKTYAF